MPNQNPHNLNASSAIRVAIVEDRPEIRDGLVQILNHADGYECVGNYGTMEDALTQLPALTTTPHVILRRLKSFRPTSLTGLSREGFDAIHVLTSPAELTATTILRK